MVVPIDMQDPEDQVGDGSDGGERSFKNIISAREVLVVEVDCKAPLKHEVFAPRVGVRRLSPRQDPQPYAYPLRQLDNQRLREAASEASSLQPTSQKTTDRRSNLWSPSLDFRRTSDDHIPVTLIRIPITN